MSSIACSLTWVLHDYSKATVFFGVGILYSCQSSVLTIGDERKYIWVSDRPSPGVSVDSRANCTAASSVEFRQDTLLLGESNMAGNDSHGENMTDERGSDRSATIQFSRSSLMWLRSTRSASSNHR